jgi:hypothetical protein
MACISDIYNETPERYLEFQSYTSHNKKYIWALEVKEIEDRLLQLKVVMNRFEDEKFEDEFEDIIQGLIDITERMVYDEEFPRSEILISLYDEYTNDISCIPFMFVDVYKVGQRVYVKKCDDKLQEIHLFPSILVIEDEELLKPTT